MHPNMHVATQNAHPHACAMETHVNTGDAAKGMCSSSAEPRVQSLRIGMGLGAGSGGRGSQMGGGKE